MANDKVALDGCRHDRLPFRFSRPPEARFVLSRFSCANVLLYRIFRTCLGFCSQLSRAISMNALAFQHHPLSSSMPFRTHQAFAPLVLIVKVAIGISVTSGTTVASIPNPINAPLTTPAGNTRCSPARSSASAPAFGPARLSTLIRLSG